MPRPSKNPKPPQPKLSMTVNQWCDAHSVSRAHAYQLMLAGKLQYTYVGRTRRIPADLSRAVVTADTS